MKLQSRTAPLFLLLALSAAPLHADFIVGQVVDANGVGVPGVDIDVDNLGSGGDPDIFNDGTDANGFFVTTVPAGIYDILFSPPPPPVTSHLVEVLHDVVVFGTTDLGVITLPPGVTLSGRVLDPGGFPVANVGLNVFDEAIGQEIIVRNDFTNAFGNFQIAVPANPIELRFDASSVVGQTLASAARPLSPTEPTNIGDQALENGFPVSGKLVRTNLTPVPDADTDFVDVLTGERVYTPGDNTNSLGIFSVVVPAGTFDVKICPQPAQRLVARELKSVAIAAPTVMPDVTLQPGVVLTGHVTDGLGNPIKGTDLDAADSFTGSKITLCSDNTDASGNYSIIVPTGTLDVTFSAPYDVPLGQTVVAGLGVTGSSVLGASLPPCSFGDSFGRGTPGTGGIVPSLGTVGGTPRVSNTGWALRLEGARGGSQGLILLSFDPLALPAMGGGMSTSPGSTGLGGTSWFSTANPTIFKFPVLLVGPAGVPGAGATNFPSPVPQAFLLGKTLYGQFGVSDPNGRGGIATSAGIEITFCL